MVNQIRVIYEVNGVDVSLSLNDDYDRPERVVTELPHMLARIIRDLRADLSYILEELKDEFAESLSQYENDEED